MTAAPQFLGALTRAAAGTDMNKPQEVSAGNAAAAASVASEPKARPRARAFQRYHPLNGSRGEREYLRSIDFAGNEDVVRAYLRGISCVQGCLPWWAARDERSSTFDRPESWRPARVTTAYDYDAKQQRKGGTSRTTSTRS